MSETRKFRTQNGFCHVMPDRIVFTHSGIYGQLGDLAGEGKMIRVLILFGALSASTLYLAYTNFMSEQLFWAILFATIGGYLIYGIIANINTTLHPIIIRNQIIEVIYVKESGMLSFPSFQIKFKDENGRKKRRIINLPRTSAKNSQDIKTAIGIMTEEGLISK